jgi:hypothetical protein
MEETYSRAVVIENASPFLVSYECRQRENSGGRKKELISYV